MHRQFAVLTVVLLISGQGSLAPVSASGSIGVQPGKGKRDVRTDVGWDKFTPGWPSRRRAQPAGGNKPSKPIPRCTFSDGGGRELPIWFEESMRTNAVLRWKECPPETGEVSEWVLIPVGDPAKAPQAPVRMITPKQLAERAHNTLPLPSPQVLTDPNLTEPQENAKYPPHTLVKLPTWWWVTNTDTLTQRTQAGPIWVDVTATPMSTAWNPTARGKRLDTTRCKSLGVPFEVKYRPPAWRPSKPNGAPAPTDACIHTPTRADRNATANIDMTWEVTWVASTGESGTLPPIITTTTLKTPTFERHSIITS